ncbi:hypothetical protein CEE36_00690 [candidate division TA06 bacterium B3_TA06]|uniref:Fibronectin type-III domain-containing protein n=1 Tax=candidate division TA06 bacterium B3_TA06 TaxID=2012487 RepID=A0A532VAU4_UNCT6|nr:MAG: hypothetical protein CEE36_00690 [candidate division TA06 bacterium B3_TA06]
MKHLKLSVILLGVVLIIGCSMEPDAPKLISPQDGEVFDMIPPTFIWSSEEYAEGYAIIVDETPPDLGDLIGSMPFSDELADTTVTMPQEAFDLLNNITYYWHVASMWTENGDTSYVWSEWRSFVVQKPGEPSPPILISPEDSAVFETNPPTFIWGFDSLAKSCVIRISTGSTTILQDTLEDTTYTMSIEMFDTLENGIYLWAVANLSKLDELFWCNSRTFILNKPVDLDTTYFPFGRGYEWCYEKHHYGYRDPDSPEDTTGLEWDNYDTTTLGITDSTWEGDTLVFGPDWFYCIEPRIWQDSIRIHTGSYFSYWFGSVSISKPEPYESNYGSNRITIRNDTMCLVTGGYNGGYRFNSNQRISAETKNMPVTCHSVFESRVKRIGTITQGEYYWQSSPQYHDGTDYRLLYFYNGRDTVYKAE